MATRGLKKIIRKIYLNAKETDPSKRTFVPTDYNKNWERAVKYLNAQGKRLEFNVIFSPLYAALYTEMRMEGVVKKQAKLRAKAKAKEITKAQIATKAATKQDSEKQEAVLPET